MSKKHNLEYEYITKDIVVALIQKSTLACDELLDYACKAYDKVYGHLSGTLEEEKKLSEVNTLKELREKEL
ncbi:MAG: hypothetical protein P4L59_19720 [Desulfosporosinus sp.]|nr:hypothetical protein [Desulfosporosinus sp.]